MADAIRIGDPPIKVRLRRHPAARRMILRIGQGADEAVLTLPPGACAARARGFALENEGWLRRRLAETPPRIAVRDGVALPYRGGELILRAGAGRAELGGGELRLPGSTAALPVRAAAFLREQARQRCLAAAERHAGRLRRRFNRLTMRDTHGRWGSCTAEGDLMFSWRLILAPDPVLDYVAAHETAHLVEMNHSSRFWSLVARLDPDHAASREWLRRRGPGLLAYDFTPGLARTD